MRRPETAPLRPPGAGWSPQAPVVTGRVAVTGVAGDIGAECVVVGLVDQAGLPGPLMPQPGQHPGPARSVGLARPFPDPPATAGVGRAVFASGQPGRPWPLSG